MSGWRRNIFTSCTTEELIEIITKPTAGYVVLPNDPYNEVFPRLYIGDGTTAICTSILRKIGITHVVNASWGKNKNLSLINTSPEFYRSCGIDFIGVEALDLSVFPLNQFFERVADYVHDALITGGRVLVHCGEGISRSATLVLAYLMIKCGYTAQEAVKQVRQYRAILPNGGFLKQICELNDKLIRQRQAQQTLAFECENDITVTN